MATASFGGWKLGDYFTPPSVNVSEAATEACPAYKYDNSEISRSAISEV